jgi:polyferredoxin
MASHDDRRLTVVHAAAALIAVLLIVQMWLLAATLESYLAGHTEAALPGAIVAAILFAGCVLLDSLVDRIGRDR